MVKEPHSRILRPFGDTAMAERKPMTTFNRATLAKVLEMLDSANAGEALAAAKLAATMVREAGLTWDDVLAASIAPRTAHPSSSGPVGSGPFGYRKDRELSPHEQFFMVLLSPRTPAEIKKRLRGLEARVLDGEITPQESLDLRSMYQNYVA
jgi:hypothetical protein